MASYTPMPPGKLLKNDRYRIRQFMTSGGFGAVYLAEDTVLGNRWCILKESFDQTEAGRKQFEIEVATLSNLSHPHLVRVTDSFSETDRSMYLVMEYVQGQDLEDILRFSPQGLLEQQVLTWMDQILDAVAYCHNFNPKVVHRDIKPGNIRIRQPDGKAILVDFGIAKIGDKSAKTEKAAQGYTPGYSPLEQYGKEGTDTYSDVYALGATMYHLLTGQHPPEAVDRAHGSATLSPPTSLKPAISQNTSHVIMTAMALRSHHRYQTATDMRMALQGQHPHTLCPHCNSAIRVGAKFCHMCGRTTTLTRPFIFPRANHKAHSVNELVQGCDLYWDEASVLFWQGQVDHWLSDLGEDQLAETARIIRTRHRDHSAGLQEFLEMAAPTRSRPILTVSPDPLNFGPLQQGDSRVLNLTIINTGIGYLHGNIVARPAGWLSVYPDKFGCQPFAPQTIQVEINSNKLTGSAQGSQYAGQLYVQSNRGHQTVAVQLTVLDPPEITIKPAQVDFGTVAYGATANKEITIANKGSDPIQATVRSQANWLLLLAPGGNRLSQGQSMPLMIGGNDHVRLQVALDSSQVAVKGKQNGAVQIKAPDACNPTVSVNFSVNVNPPFLLDTASASSAIRSPDELWRWCDAHWKTALGHLNSGRLTACLRFLGETTLTQVAAVARQKADSQAGLEILLRACGAPVPKKYQINQRDVEDDLGFGFLPKPLKKPRIVAFKILNKDRRGYIHGRLETTAVWLDIPEPHFGCRPGEIAEVLIYANHNARKGKFFWASEHLFDLVID